MCFSSPYLSSIHAIIYGRFDSCNLLERDRVLILAVDLFLNLTITNVGLAVYVYAG